MDDCDKWECEGCGAVFSDDDLMAYRDMWLCLDCLHEAQNAASEEEDQIEMSRWGGL